MLVTKTDEKTTAMPHLRHDNGSGIRRRPTRPAHIPLPHHCRGCRSGYRDSALPGHQLRHARRRPPGPAPGARARPLGRRCRGQVLRLQRHPAGRGRGLRPRLRPGRPQRATHLPRRLPARRRRVGRLHAPPLPPQPPPPLPLRRQRGALRPHRQVPLVPARPRHGQPPPRATALRDAPRQGQHHARDGRPRWPERVPALRGGVPRGHRRRRRAPAPRIPRAHRLVPLRRHVHLLHLVGEPHHRAAHLRAARAVAGAGVPVPRPGHGAVVHQPPRPHARRRGRRHVPRGPLRRQAGAGRDRLAQRRGPRPVRRQRAERCHVQPQRGEAPGVRRRDAAAAGHAHAGVRVRALQRGSQGRAWNRAALGSLLPQRQRGVRGRPGRTPASSVLPSATAGNERPAVPREAVVRGEDGPPRGDRERDGGERAGGGGVRGRGGAVRPRAARRRVPPAGHDGRARELRLQRSLEQVQQAVRRVVLLPRPRRGDDRRSQPWIVYFPQRYTGLNRMGVSS